ncbi:MAG: DUF2070 family protein, partial [Halovenus sp.]
MTTAQSNLAGLSRYIFRAPQWYASLAVAIVLAAGTGIVAFDSAYPLDDAWRGVFFIGLPTVVASIFTAPVDNLLGGRLTSNGASLLALIGELVLIATIVTANLISILFGLTQQFVFDALIVSLAAIFAIRLFVMLVLSQRNALRSAV